MGGGAEVQYTVTCEMQKSNIALPGWNHRFSHTILRKFATNDLCSIESWKVFQNFEIHKRTNIMSKVNRKEKCSIIFKV